MTKLTKNPRLKKLVEKFKKAHEHFCNVLPEAAYRLAREAAEIGRLLQEIQKEGGFKTKRRLWICLELEVGYDIPRTTFYRCFNAAEWWGQAEIVHGQEALTDVSSLKAIKLLANPKVEFDPIDEGWKKKGDTYTQTIQGVQCEILHPEGKNPTLKFNGQIHSCAGSLKDACTIAAETAVRMAKPAVDAPAPTAEEKPVVRSPEEEGWRKKDDGWHKGGYRIFAQEDGVCQIWTDAGLIAKTPDVSDALVFVDQDIDESAQEQKDATIPYPAVMESQDAANADPNDEQKSKRLTEQYHITRRRGKVNGNPWRLMRGTEVINDFKTEEAALAAKDECIRALKAIIKLDPNDFDNQWVDVKGDGSLYTNRLYKLHGLSCKAGGKYNAFFDGSIGLAAPGGTPGGATCKNLVEAKAACKKHYMEKVLPIGDENAKFLKDAVEAKGMRFTSPHFIHFDIEKIGYLGHRNVLTFTSEHQDLIDMLLEGASAEVLDLLRRRLGVQKCKSH